MEVPAIANMIKIKAIIATKATLATISDSSLSLSIVVFFKTSWGEAGAWDLVSNEKGFYLFQKYHFHQNGSVSPLYITGAQLSSYP